MISQSQIIQLKGFLETAQSILVLVNADSELDTLAASSALFLTLVQNGKEVVYVSPDLPSAKGLDLAGVDQIKSEISNKNLSISFDHVETAVDKVSYHIGEKTNRFYLTVQPQKGHSPLNKDSVEVNYTGAQADLVFLVGVSDYESLDQLYIGNEQFFNDTTVVSINNFDSSIGDIKLNTADYLNLSSALAELIKQLQLDISSDAATNLLMSIEEKADNFKSLSTTPDLLETAAWLMRQGARRIRRTKKLTKPAQKIASKDNQKKAKQQPVKVL